MASYTTLRCDKCSEHYTVCLDRDDVTRLGAPVEWTCPKGHDNLNGNNADVINVVNCPDESVDGTIRD